MLWGVYCGLIIKIVIMTEERKSEIRLECVYQVMRVAYGDKPISVIISEAEALFNYITSGQISAK